MFEQFPGPEQHNESQEQAPITKDQVIEAFKTKGKESAEALELYQNWIEQNKLEIRKTILDLEKQVRADFAFEIEKIKILIETDFLEIAWDELNGSDGAEGMIDAAVNDEEIKQVNDLLDEIEAKR